MCPIEINLVSSRAKTILGGLSFGSFGTFMIYAAFEFESAGRVTPMFIGWGLLCLSISLMLIELCKSSLIPPPPQITGSLFRRALFIGLMILWVIALPYVGFVLAGCIAFAAISAAVPKNHKAMPYQFLINTLAGVLTTVVFWLVLTSFLKVPLPEGIVF